MSTLHSRSAGFSIIELVVAILFVAILGSVLWLQKHDIETGTRDSTRKTSINALHHNLEEVFYAANKFYPEKITPDALKGMDSAHFKDPLGVIIGEQKSDYRYEPRECVGGKCRGYTLRADLEQEVDFVKDSRFN